MPKGPYDATTMSSNAFVTGFLDGYQTMDAIASLAFGVIIILNVRSLGVKDKKEELKEESIAAICAGVIFVLIYSLIAIIGAKGSLYFPESKNGAELLLKVTTLVFGRSGNLILSLVFILACLNTAIGLLSSCAEYFSLHFSFLSYKKWLLVFALVSMALSNLGLNLILKLSVPLLELLYPISIILIVLSLIPLFDRGRYVYILPVYTALCFSAIETFIPTISKYIPLSSYSLSWIIPSLLALVIGLVIDKGKKKKGESFNTSSLY